MIESCPGLVAERPPLLAARRAALPTRCGITYIGHSTFLIESPQLVRIATDYNDYVRPPVLPDIVTMNHAHTTHYTDSPDPGHQARAARLGRGAKSRRASIMHVQGRARAQRADQYPHTGAADTERHGNSIFIFEIANLCIAHLGHLHHTLTQQQLNEIGRVDVVLVPVDGSYTLDLEGMVEVLHALKAPLMIPMHYFSAYTLDRFLVARAAGMGRARSSEVPSVVVSKTTLPAKPKVLVLPGH